MSLPAHEVSDTRTRILEATAQCIADDGIAAVRMATIAKAAGVSTALLHYHFATKEHLFESVLRYSYESTTVLDEDSLRGSGRPPAERRAERAASRGGGSFMPGAIYRRARPAGPSQRETPARPAA